jgi:hypothetical protein
MANDLLKCNTCGAIFNVLEMTDVKTDSSDEDSTQYGLLISACPKCQAEVPLTLAQLQQLLAAQHDHP